jgi:L-lactate dehydrogenase complex protein LldE
MTTGGPDLRTDGASSLGADRPRRAALFITCLADVLFPRVALSAARVLDRLGVEPVFPEGQTCCGQPAFNAGYRDEARRVARHFIEVFEPHEWVVAPSGSCVAMVRDHYPELFEGDPLLDRARALAARTFELTEFLTGVLRAEGTGARFPHRVTYHDSCHGLRNLGLREGPRRLIRSVGGIDLVELPGSDSCCGFGGVFSVKYPAISMAMCDDKVARIEATGAEFVIATDASCLMNMGGALERRGARARPLHIAELLAEGI